MENTDTSAKCIECIPINTKLLLSFMSSQRKDEYGKKLKGIMAK